MRKGALCVTLLAGLIVVSGVGALRATHADGPSDLERGIQEVKAGNFEKALLTLDGVTRSLKADPQRHSELAQAYLYLGVAYVGLLQEEPAKARFKDALKLDEALTLDPNEFPPRTIRVFEAAKKGSNKSVLYAGGGIGVGAIIAGVALAGSVGTVSVEAAGPSPSPPAPPTTTTTTLPSPNGTIEFLSSTPGPGSTISGCGTGSICNLAMSFRYRPTRDITNVLLTTRLLTSAGQVCLEGTETARESLVRAGQDGFANQSNFRSSCAVPFTTSIIRAEVLTGSSVFITRDFSVTYNLR